MLLLCVLLKQLLHPRIHPCTQDTGRKTEIIALDTQIELSTAVHGYGQAVQLRCFSGQAVQLHCFSPWTRSYSSSAGSDAAAASLADAALEPMLAPAGLAGFGPHTTL